MLQSSNFSSVLFPLVEHALSCIARRIGCTTKHANLYSNQSWRCWRRLVLALLESTKLSMGSTYANLLDDPQHVPN